jgi:hypothetical protein
MLFLSVVCSLFQGPRVCIVTHHPFLYQKLEASARGFFSLPTDYDEDYTYASVLRRIDRDFVLKVQLNRWFTVAWL